MPSYQVRNTQQETAEYRAVQSKRRDTSLDGTVGSSGSMSPIASKDPKDRMVAQKLVRHLADDIIRTANDYDHTPGGHSSRQPTRLVRTRSGSDSSADPVEDQVADESKTHWVDEEDKDQVQFSVQEIQRMVLESLPDEVRKMVPPETWDRIFSEASEDEILSLRNTKSEEDITDLVSFVSVYVKREARGRPRGDSDVSEMTYPNVEPPRRSSGMDAVALAVPPGGNVIVEYNEEEPKDLESERRTSRHSSVNLATGQPTRSLAVSSPAPRQDKPSDSGPSGKGLAREEPQVAVPSNASNERRIKFTCVEIRYYEQILSDNPAVTSGPPVGLGWKYRIMKKDMSVDAWEHRQRPNRRYLTALIITRHERTSLLYDLGYSQKNIALVVRDVLKIKNKRKQTYNNLRFQNMEEMMESTICRFKNVLTLGLAKRKEKKMLAQYM